METKEKQVVKRPRVLTLPNMERRSPSSLPLVPYIPTKKQEPNADEEYEQWYYYYNQPPKERESEHPKYQKNRSEITDAKPKKINFKFNLAIEA